LYGRQAYIYKKHFTLEQYEVCWNKGTEPPFSGKYHKCKDKGIHKCVCCDNSVFTSDTKFDSGTGWPSFSTPIKEASVKEELYTVIEASKGRNHSDGRIHSLTFTGTVGSTYSVTVADLGNREFDH
jgi:methionine-R-sulfoxide reductase